MTRFIDSPEIINRKRFHFLGYVLAVVLALISGFIWYPLTAWIFDRIGGF